MYVYLFIHNYSWKRNVYTPCNPNHEQTIKQGYEVHTALVIDGEILVDSGSPFESLYDELLFHLQWHSREYLQKCMPMIGDGKKYMYFWNQKLNCCPVSRPYVCFSVLIFYYV